MLSPGRFTNGTISCTVTNRFCVYYYDSRSHYGVKWPDIDFAKKEWSQNHLFHAHKAISATATKQVKPSIFCRTRAIPHS